MFMTDANSKATTDAGGGGGKANKIMPLYSNGTLIN